MDERKLTRSSDKVIAGVCGGIGEYLGIDANLVRVVFLVLVFIQPSTVLLYLLLALLIPGPGDEAEPLSERIRSGAEEIESGLKRLDGSSSNRLWLGAGLLALGVALLLQNLGFVWFDWSWLGAALLIAAGGYLLLSRGD